MLQSQIVGTVHLLRQTTKYQKLGIERMERLTAAQQMRDTMKLFEGVALNEKAMPAPLPPAVESVIDRPVTVLLKNKRPMVLTMTRRAHEWESKPQTHLIIEATIDGTRAGSVFLVERFEKPGTFQSVWVDVVPSFRRWGVATAMLDFAAKLGLTVSVDAHGKDLIGHESTFWSKRGRVGGAADHDPEPQIYYHNPDRRA